MILLTLWVVVLTAFGYMAVRPIRLLVAPRSIRGVLQSVQGIEAGTHHSFWFQISDSVYQAKYEKRLCQLLSSLQLQKATVGLKSGVGRRIISIELVDA